VGTAGTRGVCRWLIQAHPHFNSVSRGSLATQSDPFISGAYADELQSADDYISDTAPYSTPSMLSADVCSVPRPW
jgi:hypothetical protein